MNGWLLLRDLRARLAAASAAAPDEREVLARAFAEHHARKVVYAIDYEHADVALTALAARPAPDGHPLDRLCNDPAPTLNLPGAMPVPPPVYCARTKGHEPPHAHGQMTWAARPAPVVNADDVKRAAAVLLAGYQQQYDGGQIEEFLDLARAVARALGLTVADEGRAEA